MGVGAFGFVIFAGIDPVVTLRCEPRLLCTCPWEDKKLERTVFR